MLTVDIPLIRLSNGDTWTILLLRSGMTFLSCIVVWSIWRLLRTNVPPLVPGWTGVAVASLYAMGTVTFMLAVFNTSTANLVFILAFNSMFAALLSWIFLKERPRPITIVAMFVMLSGVLLIVSDGVGTGNFIGNLLALATACLLASAITVSRASRKDMGFTPLVAVLLPFSVALVMVSKGGFHVETPWWIIFNGAIVMPIAFFCLANGPKYISGPEVAMFYLLETVLAPVWVWMIFSEVPSRNSLIGGTILIVTLVIHSLWQLNDVRRRRATLALRHPA
ncbi:DMT family transporter [Pseudaminobacter sp. NGMCC 1.201702]|uniref:DMT family transporter n=1 Tax=Pseudaminobacter sp. NGMCC 1.201702 TaxID=3391825 RepID=UPI0039F01D82